MLGLAVAIIASMLVIPLLDAQQAYAFSERQQRKADVQNVEKAAQADLEAAQAEQSGRNFNPEINPLANTTTDSENNGFGESSSTSDLSISQSPISDLQSLSSSILQHRHRHRLRRRRSEQRGRGLQTGYERL